MIIYVISYTSADSIERLRRRRLVILLCFAVYVSSRHHCRSLYAEAMQPSFSAFIFSQLSVQIDDVQHEFSKIAKDCDAAGLSYSYVLLSMFRAGIIADVLT